MLASVPSGSTFLQYLFLSGNFIYSMVWYMWMWMRVYGPGHVCLVSASVDGIRRWPHCYPLQVHTIRCVPGRWWKRRRPWNLFQHRRISQTIVMCGVANGENLWHFSFFILHIKHRGGRKTQDVEENTRNELKINDEMDWLRQTFHELV